MEKLWQFLTKWTLPGMLIFFLAFIPLYPKLPLFDIFGTWVYIRLEDFLVLIAAIIVGILIAAKKISLKTPLTRPILIYWSVGLISLTIAILFIFPHLPNIFPHIAILHYIRRIEYMVLFFLGFAVISHNKRLLPIIVGVLVVTALSIVIYGLGQKYQGFPAFSTMNEEFAKGLPLRLPPTARIMSTFAGHYDLAAYLVLTIPLFGSLIFGTKRWLVKIVLFVVAVSSFILLLLTASRVSFGVYLLTISSMLWWQKKRWLIIPVIIASIVMVNFVSGASDRFLKTLRFNDVVVDLSTGKAIGTLEKVEGGTAVLERISEPDEENLPKGSGFINVPSQPSAVPTASIEQIEFFKKKELVAGKGDVATISGSFLIQKAFVLDISITTRFQGQWPKAIAAFKRNILTGSGFSSLSLAADGNYHRMLGETGILGTIAFLGIFLYAFVWFWQKKDLLEPLERSFVIGIFAGIVGLCANAVLIDVFEASKVAFPLWMLMGIAMALLAKHEMKQGYLNLLYRFFTNRFAIVAYLGIWLFFLFGTSLSHYFIGDDFTWLRWAAESTTSDIWSYITNAQGFFYRPVPKFWYFSLFSVFWLMPQAYHIASIVLFFGITLNVFFLLRKLNINTVLAGLTTILFTVLAIHHENIYWISGQSSLLAVFFFLSSLNTFLYYVFEKQKRFAYMVAVVLLVLSLGSWETLVIGPIIICLFEWVLYDKRSSLPLLITMPLYWLIRTSSGAVPAEGDYGYNVSRLLVNAIGNTVTYFLSIIIGPKVIEQAYLVREMVRQYSQVLSVIGFSLTGIVLFIIWKSRQFLLNLPIELLLTLSLFVSFIPFYGLGAASERYVLLPSVFFILLIGYGLSKIFNSKYFWIMKVLILIGVVIVMGWNYRELKRIETEWQFSSQVTEQALRTIKTNYFPPTLIRSFVFLDVPIRAGRAWIFPTGLNDALWHMYRQTPYYVTQVRTFDDAFEYPHINGTDKVVLQFENYALKQVVKETVTVDKGQQQK